MKIKTYMINLGLALSQLLNTLLGGDPDETLSSRVGKRYQSGRLTLWAKLVLWVTGVRHVTEAIEPDEGTKAAYKE